MRRIAMWIVWNVPLPGWLAPRMFGWAIGAKGMRQVRPPRPATTEGR